MTGQLAFWSTLAFGVAIVNGRSSQMSEIINIISKKIVDMEDEDRRHGFSMAPCPSADWHFVKKRTNEITSKLRLIESWRYQSIGLSEADDDQPKSF